MTVCWKAWKNDKTVFPPFPQTLEIASQRFPHSHRRDDYGMNISERYANHRPRTCLSKRLGRLPQLPLIG